MNYYNEFDPHAAAWLRELISERLIPRGLVDDRSITEVKAEDLEGFTQCHFFAGIGGWSYALQLAGIPATTRLWTGSPPCQPFSVAGKQLGQLDERHLAPTFMRLVDQCRPAVLFGEQVAAAIGKHWLDDLFTEMERQGYTCGAAVLPAASVGAPHKRDRLFFGAVGDAAHLSQHWSWNAGASGRDEHSDNGAISRMAYTNDSRLERRERVFECTHEQSAGTGGMESELADSASQGQPHGGSGAAFAKPSTHGGESRTTGTNPHHGFWSDADWLGCRDGKFRPVEPSTFPLANGLPARVGRLRGYGNAIVPQVAAEFITAFMDAAVDAAKG